MPFVPSKFQFERWGKRTQQSSLYLQLTCVLRLNSIPGLVQMFTVITEWPQNEIHNLAPIAWWLWQKSTGVHLSLDGCNVDCMRTFNTMKHPIPQTMVDRSPNHLGTYCTPPARYFLQLWSVKGWYLIPAAWSDPLSQDSEQEECSYHLESTPTNCPWIWFRGNNAFRKWKGCTIKKAHAYTNYLFPSWLYV